MLFPLISLIQSANVHLWKKMGVKNTEFYSTLFCIKNKTVFINALNFKK